MEEKTNRKGLLSRLKSLDKFGANKSFKVRQDKSLKTYIGALLSILINLLIFIYGGV